MPGWLLTWVLPIVIQGLTPLIIEGVRKAVAAVMMRVPGSLTVVLAGALGEGLNAVQGTLTGTTLPPGVPGLLSIILNEIKNDVASAAGPAPKSGI